MRFFRRSKEKSSEVKGDDISLTNNNIIKYKPSTRLIEFIHVTQSNYYQYIKNLIELDEFNFVLAYATIYKSHYDSYVIVKNDLKEKFDQKHADLLGICCIYVNYAVWSTIFLNVYILTNEEEIMRKFNLNDMEIKSINLIRNTIKRIKDFIKQEKSVSFEKLYNSIMNELSKVDLSKIRFDTPTKEMQTEILNILSDTILSGKIIWSQQDFYLYEYIDKIVND